MTYRRTAWDFPDEQLPMIALFLRLGRREYERSNSLQIRGDIADIVDELERAARVVTQQKASGIANDQVISAVGTTDEGDFGNVATMKISEAAVITGLSPRRLRQLAGTPRLPGHQGTDRDWHVSRDAVDYLAQRRKVS